MSSKQREALAEDYREQVADMDTLSLEHLFQSYVTSIEVYTTMLGGAPKFGEDDIVRVNVMREVLTSRSDAEIRFH